MKKEIKNWIIEKLGGVPLDKLLNQELVDGAMLYDAYHENKEENALGEKTFGGMAKQLRWKLKNKIEYNL